MKRCCPLLLTPWASQLLPPLPPSSHVLLQQITPAQLALTGSAALKPCCVMLRHALSCCARPRVCSSHNKLSFSTRLGLCTPLLCSQHARTDKLTRLCWPAELDKMHGHIQRIRQVNVSAQTCLFLRLPASRGRYSSVRGQMADMDSNSASGCSEMDERRLTLLARAMLLLLHLMHLLTPSHDRHTVPHTDAPPHDRHPIT